MTAKLTEYWGITVWMKNHFLRRVENPAVQMESISTYSVQHRTSQCKLSKIILKDFLQTPLQY